jgi:hypothetical protein
MVIRITEEPPESMISGYHDWVVSVTIAVSNTAVSPGMPPIRPELHANPEKHYAKAGMVQPLNCNTAPRSAISATSDLCIWGTIAVANNTVSPGLPPHKAQAT